MISYAQNAEDAVLARLFRTQVKGFYIDLGAGHPVLDSVTKHFYDRGWRGMNVEPMRQMFDLLCEDRPEDINVHAAVSSAPGRVTLYEAPEGNLGSSTLDDRIASAYAAEGRPFTPVSVDAVTLTSLVAEHGVGHVDFLKIDVEGHELEVISSMDWSAFRPRVLVIEAVKPNSTEPSHEAWESFLVDANYVCTLFDGINRFYAQANDTEARQALSAPANALDEVEPWRWVSQLEGAKEHVANVEEARRRAELYAEELSSRLPKAGLARRLLRLIGGRRRRMTQDEPGDRFAALAVTTFGVFGLAIAVPLLVVLGGAPTLFVAHGTARLDVLTFVASLLLAPVVAVLAILLLFRWVFPRAIEPTIDVLVGLSSAAVIVPNVDQAFGLASWSFLLVGVTVAALVGVAHHRNRSVRRFMRMTTVGTVAVTGWFLFASPASSLILPQTHIEGARADSDDNVLFLVFDELPLAALLDDEGEINVKRFPGFGRLTRRSTWYPQTTTIAPWTHLAIPALLSGNAHSRATAPTPRNFPRNFFRMLVPTHDLEAYETSTFLCTSRQCAAQKRTKRSLHEDAAAVYLHALLPDDLATRSLPPIDNQWGDFEWPEEDWKKIQKARGKADPVSKFDQLVRSVGLRPDARATAWFAHIMLPHLPLRYLPNGEVYDSDRLPRGLNHGVWSKARPLSDAARQRFLLQLKYVDTLVGRLLDRLEASGAYDRTLVIVTSDHGISFTPGESRRATPLKEATVADVLPVPLFVKYPGQTKGRTDTRAAEIIDIMPTIADVLDVRHDGSWEFRGTSLLDDDARHEGPITYLARSDEMRPPERIDIGGAVRPYLDLFGGWRAQDDLFAWGPHWRLYGRSILSTDRSTVSARWIHDKRDGTESSTDPLVRLRFDRRPESDWFALVSAGRVVGLGRTYDETDKYFGEAVLDPANLPRGREALQGFFIDDDGEASQFPIYDSRPSG